MTPTLGTTDSRHCEIKKQNQVHELQFSQDVPIFGKKRKKKKKREPKEDKCKLIKTTHIKTYCVLIVWNYWSHLAAVWEIILNITSQNEPLVIWVCCQRLFSIKTSKYERFSTHTLWFSRLQVVFTLKGLRRREECALQMENNHVLFKNVMFLHFTECSKWIYIKQQIFFCSRNNNRYKILFNSLSCISRQSSKPLSDGKGTHSLK